MKIHRFYFAASELEYDFWLSDEKLVHQWTKVLRFRIGQRLVLFDGEIHDRLYEIKQINKDTVRLIHVTDYERKLPKKNIYLLWSLLKKDKNDWVLQKCTELGVSHFLPLIADRSEKTGFNVYRAERIVIEAAEQCGRSDIPKVREPVQVEAAIKQLNGKLPLLVCEQGERTTRINLYNMGILVGPEGGWSEKEKELFEDSELPKFAISDFTLRAETAAIISSGLIA